MKKLWVVGLLMLFLAGCGEQTVFETVNDVYVQSVNASVGQIAVNLPEDASVEVMKNEEGEQVYLCDGYTVSLHTLPGGDLGRTLKTVTGYDASRLRPVQFRQGELKRTECVWSCAGEGGDQVGRCAILDDGSFHYVVSVMAEGTHAGGLSQTWQELLGSFTVLGTGH